MCHHTTAKSFTRIVFTFPPQHVLRGGFLGMSCQSRDRVPFFTGFSSIRMWVTLTAPFTTALGRQASFTRLVGTHNRIRPYKGIRIHPFTYAFFLFFLSISCALELQCPSPHVPPQPSPAMSGAGGKWMVSSVMEGHIKKLRKAGYLSNDIALPASRKGAAPPHPKAP